MPLPKLNESVEQKGTGRENGENEKPATRARATVATLIPDELKTAAVEALRESMKASRRYYDKDAKAWLAEADHATRLRAAELVLAYAEGRPVERKFELRGNVETFEDRKEQLMKSPEGVRFLLAAGAIGAKEASEALGRIIEASGA